MANRKQTPKPERKGSRGGVVRVIAVVLVAATALALAAWWLAAREPAPGSRPPVTAGGGGLRLPAEFEPQDVLFVGGTQLVKRFPRVLVDIVEAAREHVTAVVLVSTQDDEYLVRRLLTRRRVPAGGWRIQQVHIRSMWVRDFAPLTVLDGAGNRRFAGFDYQRRNGNVTDNTVPAGLAGILDVPLQEFPLLLEGGDFLSNGRGVCLSSDRMLKRNVYYREINDREMGEMLVAGLGFTRWDAVPQLKGEKTGHLDMYVTLAAPDLAVIGSCAESEDPQNAALLDEAAAKIAATRTGDGRFFRVVRIPMPPRPDGIWRSYTNVVYVNGLLLVPQYPDTCPELDTRALEIYRGLLPSWRVVGIDVSDLIHMAGALRCVTMNSAAAPAAGPLYPE